MKKSTILFSIYLLCVPTFVFGACSVANLTHCLDSVCAINIGANPAARCQYCGSSASGTPKPTAMKNISAGTSTRYTISNKELKNAPVDAGERYVWGTKLCLEKLPECTADDVSNNYDYLIEQSCKAVGISTEMTNLAKKANIKKDKNSCSDELRLCIIDTKRCGSNYRKCESDSEFDKYFSECTVASIGCDEFSKEIKNTLISARNTSVANADKLLQNIVNSYKNAREQKLSDAQISCKNNAAKTECVENVCANNMRNKCAAGFEYEKIAADELCKFYDIACERLK